MGKDEYLWPFEPPEYWPESMKAEYRSDVAFYTGEQWHDISILPKDEERPKLHINKIKQFTKS
jgi:hypothetical protein